MNTTNFSRVNHDNLADCRDVFIRVFNAAPWSENWQAEAALRRLEDIFQAPGFSGLLCQVAEENVGFALGNIERWDEIRHFHLREMCVVGAQQRRGIGAALMNALEANLASKGVERLYLHTARDTPAQSFYEKQGLAVSTRMIMMSKRLNKR